MSIFYTGKGDKGKSHVGKQKIEKTCIEIEALGALDELNSLLGLIKSQDVSKETKAYLRNAQEKLFIIQAQVASKVFTSKFSPLKLGEKAVKEMEKIIGVLEKKIQPARKFIIPGATLSSAWLDYARAVARRTERSVLLFNKKRKIPEEVLSYINRLSSLLFALARFESKKKRVREKHPTYK